MELVSLVIDDSPGIRCEPIADALNRAAATNNEWKLFFERLLEVVAFLKSCKPAVQLGAMLISEDPPQLVIYGPNKASVDLWADYYDRAPVETNTGLHVRLQIKRDESNLTRDVRTMELGEVARQMRLAFSLRDA